jgi:hypothetical protein
MPRSHLGYVYFAVVGAILSAAACRTVVGANEEKAAKAILTPQLQDCTLQGSSRTVKPVHTQSPWRAEYRAGDLQVVLEENNSLAVQNGETRWTAKAPDGRRLYWLAGEGGRAYFGGYQVDEKTSTERLDNPPRVRRLDLASGKWLPDLPIGSQAAAPRENESILSVLADDKQVVVLSTLSGDEKGSGESRLIAYRVTCFAKDKIKPIWSKRVQSAGEPERPTALLFSARPPNSAISKIQHLAWLGNFILVCAGEVQDILCLERATGNKLWRFPRIWEQERGFIGPSVWQHVLGSARSAESTDEPAKVRPQAKANEKEKAGPRGAIIGGPVVVTLPKKRGERQEHGTFVAVAKMPEGPFANYLGECVLYEIDASGNLLAMVHLPRLVEGNRFHVQPDGVVWACQENALVKIACAKERSITIGMGGGPDLIARIPWYRQTEAEAPNAWLVAGKAGDPIAFAGDRAFRVSGGGYVVNDADHVYRFPIAFVDLKTGLDRPLTLNVPFQGGVPVPSTNYSQDFSADGKKRWHTFGPYLLAVTQLRADNGRLRVTLAMENWSGVVDFEIRELLKP